METLEIKNVSIVLPPFLMNSNGTETKDRILKAAQELFFSYGIRSITMDDIARHLSISKKTIYLFFEDKDQIVHTLCMVDNEMNMKAINDIHNQSKDPVHEILLSMDFVSEVINRMNPNVIYDMQKFHSATWNEFRVFRDKHLHDVVESNLKKGIRLGLYRSEIHVKALAKLRIEQVEMGFNPVVYPPSKFNVREVQLSLLDHFLHGILTLKGLKLLDQYQSQKKLKKQKALS